MGHVFLQKSLTQPPSAIFTIPSSKSPDWSLCLPGSPIICSSLAFKVTSPSVQQPAEALISLRVRARASDSGGCPALPAYLSPGPPLAHSLLCLEPNRHAPPPPQCPYVCCSFSLALLPPVAHAHAFSRQVSVQVSPAPGCHTSSSQNLNSSSSVFLHITYHLTSNKLLYLVIVPLPAIEIKGTCIR